MSELKTPLQVVPIPGEVYRMARLGDSDGVAIALIQREHAEQIASAVNSHAALVEALGRALNYLGTIEDPTTGVRDCIHQSEKVLALAKGEST